MDQTSLQGVTHALRSPFVPVVFEALDRVGYLGHVWPQLRPSVETAGFLGSALYLSDMALDAVLETYEPATLQRAQAVLAADAEALLAVLDVFQYVQPQSLLLCAALAEAWTRPQVGGEGRAEPRLTTDRERAHLGTAVKFASPETAPLPEVAGAFQVQYAPELYRAVATWPPVAELMWAELQHLAVYPDIRRRARALYYYARSATRFLARPLAASRPALLAAGLAPAVLDEAHAAIEAALPLTATMVVHCCAMRVGLGVTGHELPPRE